jgi:hypothetical protein
MIALNRYRILHIAGNSMADRLKCMVIADFVLARTGGSPADTGLANDKVG